MEVESNLAPKLLSLRYFQFELETNSVKSRTGIFIANKIPYRRRSNLEGNDSHIVISDIEGIASIKRIINLSHINDHIPLSWLNMSMDTFKVHYKKLFL